MTPNVQPNRLSVCVFCASSNGIDPAFLMTARRADAFLVLPGGLGTLDELCEILTWALLGIHEKPVVLVNVAGYWNAFLGMLDTAMAAGFLRERHRRIPLVAADPEDACFQVEMAGKG
jgi:uncharacterized protein (TIGR00730 family)